MDSDARKASDVNDSEAPDRQRFLGFLWRRDGNRAPSDSRVEPRA